MAERSTEHAIFEIERIYDAAPANVFAVVTVEITPAGDRTRLLYTEQTVYMDGGDTPAAREKGTREEFDNLDRTISGHSL
jgi:uncharacterized protein YndB with AHSA1/START domain